MTKAQYLDHIAGLTWLSEHDKTTCPLCKARAKTKKANLRAKTTRQMYRDLGMDRVVVNGKVFYE